MRIDNCYDSHVHWPFTGEHAEQLKLDHLQSAHDVKKLSPERHHKRGDWLLGFGWDAHGWPQSPSRQILDEIFPDIPVAFSRCDGHALWVNTTGLKRASLWESAKSVQGGRIELDADGKPTGILIDQAAELVQTQIGEPLAMDLRRHLLKGAKIFNKAGFTHIRDMTCSEAQWNEAVRLDESGLLTLAVEEYFWLKSAEHIDVTLDLIRRTRGTQTPNLRVMGLKIFYDGALGSEGAYLSRCYNGGAHRGLLLWETNALKEALIGIWSQGLHAAVHVIGDEAAHQLIEVAQDLKDAGHVGKLHLEHCELLRADTIQKMQGLAVECHLQPAHWLTDRKWLQEKLGDLSQLAFPWRALQEGDVAFDFGSDAPIEPASVARTFTALSESAEAGIPRLLGDPATYMSHRDTAWAPNSFTIFSDGKPSEVLFRGQHL